MSYAQYIREIGRGAEGARDLSSDDARQLYAAMLDGGVPDLELGAIILGLRVKGESLAEMLGFLAATEERMHVMQRPHGRVRPIVLPTYNGARKEANLTPLLAIMPSISVMHAEAALEQSGLAFLPLSALAPGAHNLLVLRSRLGVRNSAHSLVKMLDPFGGEGVLVAAATHPEFLDLMRNMLLALDRRGILLRCSEGEPFANPKRRPRLEFIHDDRVDVLFEAEHDSLRALPHLPEAADAASTAVWIGRVLDRQVPLPKPIANQLACCLFASGFAEDFSQAKAIVAVAATGRPAAAA